MRGQRLRQIQRHTISFFVTAPCPPRGRAPQGGAGLNSRG
ncbi:hypothetical protein HMPREF0970_00215 [Schaalia odontolytica F0309]|uniref:Uncharacterized protein n=1 Tax=Schaalia odontolytica F0309 TaxID=649742 RepID=D4TWA5_9ACTO|nr:hypothetical protein HMPREF0970_00215 [Schaalia odontolytica F0309]